MCKKIAVDASALDFLTGVYGERKKYRADQMLRRAFDKAYIDMANHTVQYKQGIYAEYFQGESKRVNENKQNLRDAIFDTISQEFVHVKDITNKEDFKKWHIELCNSIVNLDISINKLTDKKKKDNVKAIKDILCQKADPNSSKVFSYGQAQKLVNMMLKYLYVYDQCEGENGDLSFGKVVEYFHVPIDRYVIKAVSDIAREYDLEIKSLFVGEKYDSSPWSQLQTYNKYQECQQKIAETVKTIGYSKPFMWELGKWPFKQDVKEDI